MNRKVKQTNRNLLSFMLGMLIFLSGVAYYMGAPMVAQAAAEEWFDVGSAGFSAGNADYTSIAIDSSGTPYVVYRDYAYGNKATVMKYNGSSWVNVGSAGFSAGEAMYTSIAIDSSGTPYVVYSDAGNNYNKATVMKYNGSSWVTVGSAGFSASAAYYTSIAIDSSGTPYVVYQDGISSKATVMKYNGSSWVTVGSAGFSADIAQFTSIAVDSSGTPYVAYSGPVMYVFQQTVMKYNGSSWVTVGNAGYTAGNGVHTSIAIDSSGTPYVAYKNGQSFKATVMKYDGSSWVTVGSGGISTSLVTDTSIAIDSSGTPYVVYNDNENSNKATVKKYNGSNWVTVGSEGFSAGKVTYTSIAIDSRGTPYVVYRDGGNSNKATVMKLTMIYTVKYDGNVATSGSAPTNSTTYQSGDTAPVLGNTGGLVKTGYTFAGWNTKADGTGTDYVAGAPISIGSVDVTLYAKWTAVTVTGVTLDRSTLTLMVGGGTATLTATVSPSNAANQNVTWTSSDTSVATVDSSGVVTPVGAGITFITVTTKDGSYTATSAVAVSSANLLFCAFEQDTCSFTSSSTVHVRYGSNENYTYGDFSSAFTCDNKRFGDPAPGSRKACFILVQTVSFNSNGGTPVSSQTVNYNSTATQPADPTKTGYTFGGWYSDSGLTTSFDFNTPITVDTALYAKWTAVPVTGVTLDKSTLTLMVGGGTATLTATVSPSNAANQNVIWSSSDTSVVTVDSSGVVTPVGAGITFITVTTKDGSYGAASAVAVSSANLAFCAFEQDACSVASSSTVHVRYGSNVNYTYGDFSSAFTCGNGTFSDPAPGSVKACFIVVAQKVSFNSNGGTPVSSQTVNYNSKATRPADPTKTGYTFGGWYSDSGLNTAFDFNTPITADTTLYAKWTMTNAVTPNITTQPANQTVNEGDSASLSVAAMVSDGGTLSYQWYSNTTSSNSGGTAISGATSASYAAPTTTTTTGTTYYYVVVTNTNSDATGSQTATATSSVATVTVNAVTNAATPSIGTQPANRTVNVSSSANLSVAATVSDGGTLSYQWYKNTSNSNSGGTPIIFIGTSASLVAYQSTVGTTYYYVVVTNTNSGATGSKTATATSSVATVTAIPLTNAATPSIYSQPTGATVNEGASSPILSVAATVSDSGFLSYQWYRNTSSSNSGGTLISGARSSSYAAPTSTAGTTYYYVVVTNTNFGATGIQRATATSSAAMVTVNALTNAATPSIGTQTTGATVSEGVSSPALSVVATVSDGGTLSYQWYSNTISSNSGGAAISGAKSASYAAPTATAGTTYYYVVVTNTNSSATGSQTATATSSVVAVTVNALTNAATPSIGTQPTGATVNEGDSSPSLSVAATVSDSGTLSYQWYSNTTSSNSGGTAISGATSASYAAPTTTAGMTYYYVVVTNTNSSATGSQTATATSNAVAVVVNALTNAVTPSIGTQPTGATVSVGDSAPLSVAATVSDSGTLSYQWYSNTTSSNSGGAAISGATSASYGAPTTTTGTTYYYVVVTNTNSSATGSQTATATSSAVSVTVNALTNAATPSIGTQPTGATVNEGASSPTLSVAATVSDSGMMSYQWYSNTTSSNSGGAAISGATSTSYAAPTATAGTTYYYVVVTNTNSNATGSQTATATSSAASVMVNALTDVATPSIGTQPTGATVNEGASALLSVAATVSDSGTLSYQWYSNTTSSNGGGTSISGATSTSYAAPTTTTGTTYYYVVVTNTNSSATGSQTATATSSVATVTVNALTNAATPSIGTQPTDQKVNMGGSATLTVAASGGASLSYQWYSSTTNSTSGGTLISGATSASYAVPTTTAGTTYYYCVVTNTDTSATGSKTATATSNVAKLTVNAAVSSAPSSAPLAPTGLTAIAGNGQIALTWNGVSETVAYSVYEGTASGSYGLSPIATVSGATYSYTVTGLTNGATYYFAVKASNAGGNSNFSNEVSATPKSATPSASSNANLSSMAVSGKTLSPSFDPGTFSYKASVANGVTLVTVTPTISDSNATMTVNGTAVTSGQASGAISLSVGNNPITVAVTAQDGKTTQTYTVNVTRAEAITASSTAPIQVTTEPVSITVPASVTNAEIAVATTTAGSNKEATLPLVEVQAATTLGNVSVTIPDGTKITAPANWDGTIKLPQVQSNSSVTVNSGTVSTVIEIGSTDVSLTFDKAVRLLFPNQKGKQVGFVRNGVFTEITGTVSADTQAAADSEIAAGGDKKITVGNDLVVWTKHFTQFVIYTTVTTTGTTATSGGGDGAATNSATIAAASGGTITLNGVTIEVPAGAMASNIQVTVDKVNDISILPVDSALQLVSEVYEIKKDKDGDFSKPVVITLPFDKTKADFAKSTAGVYWLNEQTHKWVTLEILKVDEANGTASGSVSHFTKFAVLVSDKAKTAQPQTNEADFADIKGHWSEANVLELVKLSAIKGYPDNTFKPNANITRAEFVTVIVKAFHLGAQDGKTFADTETHWAKSAIATAAATGIIAGYSDNSFGPDDLITREQMAAIVVRAAKLAATDKSVNFPDSAEISDWARTALATATAKGLINGYEDGTVKPKVNTTRAEAVTVILRALQAKP